MVFSAPAQPERKNCLTACEYSLVYFLDDARCIPGQYSCILGQYSCILVHLFIVFLAPFDLRFDAAVKRRNGIGLRLTRTLLDKE